MFLCTTEEPIYIVYWIKEPVPEMPSWVVITLEKLACISIRKRKNANAVIFKTE